MDHDMEGQLEYSRTSFVKQNLTHDTTSLNISIPRRSALNFSRTDPYCKRLPWQWKGPMTVPSCIGETWEAGVRDAHQNQPTANIPLTPPWFLFHLQDFREAMSFLLLEVR